MHDPVRTGLVLAHVQVQNSIFFEDVEQANERCVRDLRKRTTFHLSSLLDADFFVIDPGADLGRPVDSNVREKIGLPASFGPDDVHQAVLDQAFIE